MLTGNTLKKTSIPKKCHSSCSTGCLLPLCIRSLSDCSSPSWRFPFNFELVKFLLNLSITYRKRIWRAQTTTVHTTIKIQTSMMECILLRNARVLHWELVNMQLVSACDRLFFLSTPAALFFIVWWGKEKLKLKEILIIVKLPPKSWKKEFRRILCRQVRGLVLSKNTFSCMSGLCYTSLLGSPAFLILNTVYFNTHNKRQISVLWHWSWTSIENISRTRYPCTGSKLGDLRDTSHLKGTLVNSPFTPLPA